MTFEYFPERIAAVPEHLQGGLRRFVEIGMRPGSGLCSVLQDDGVTVVARSLDDKAFAGLTGLLWFLYNCVPAVCWGSPKAVDDWIAGGGLEGRRERGEGTA